MNEQKFADETLHTMRYFFFENCKKYVEIAVKKKYHGLNPSDRLYISCPKCGAFMTYDGELGECFCPVCTFQGRADT